MSNPQRATAAQVAARAGVSVASVSRVLNGLNSSLGMAERVQAAAAELGYVAGRDGALAQGAAGPSSSRSRSPTSATRRTSR